MLLSRSGFQDRDGAGIRMVLDLGERSAPAARLVCHPVHMPRADHLWPLALWRCHYGPMICRRTAALTALITALPLAAFGAIILAGGGFNLAFATSQAAAPPGLRWPMVIAVACCLGASLYLVSSGTYRSARSWASLSRFAAQSFTTLGPPAGRPAAGPSRSARRRTCISIVVLLIGIVLGVLATGLAGDIF